MLGVCHPDNECNCTLVTLTSAVQTSVQSHGHPDTQLKGLCTFDQSISRMFTLISTQQNVLIPNIIRVITPVL